MTTSSKRWLDLAGTANARDLGGLPAAGGTVARDVLIRSDNLQALTPGDVRLLVDEVGLRTVFDLRTSGEVDSEGPGPLRGRPEVRHVHLSLIPEAGLPEPGAVLPDRWADGAVGAYLHYLRDAPDKFAAAVRQLGTPDAGAAIVHCAAGKDRTGVLVALVLEACGVPRDAVVADFALTNERIERIYDRLSATRTYGDDVRRIGLDAHRVDPVTMTAVLDVLDERWGGAAGYLRAAGSTDEELGALQRRLITDSVQPR